jgi:hypothetical protein
MSQYKRKGKWGDETKRGKRSELAQDRNRADGGVEGGRRGGGGGIAQKKMETKRTQRWCEAFRSRQGGLGPLFVKNRLVLRLSIEDSMAERYSSHFFVMYWNTGIIPR